MKKVLAIVLIVLILLFVLCACNGKTEVSREVIDWSYTAPFDGMETDYVYKYNVFSGEFVLVPEVKTVHHDAVYKIQYRVTYDDGSTADVWEEVTAAEYEKVTQ